MSRVLKLADRIVLDVEDVSATRPFGQNGGFQIVSVSGAVIATIDFASQNENDKAFNLVEYAIKYSKDSRTITHIHHAPSPYRPDYPRPRIKPPMRVGGTS